MFITIFIIQDVMTPGGPEKGVFSRIYYPSIYPVNETINKVRKQDFKSFISLQLKNKIEMVILFGNIGFGCWDIQIQMIIKFATAKSISTYLKTKNIVPNTEILNNTFRILFVD